MATTITSGTDVYGIKEGSRQLCRASNGNLYCAIHNVTQEEIEVYKSTDEGDNWTQQDSSNSPGLRHSSHDNYAPAMCIDEDDVLHLNWWENKSASTTYSGNVGLEYVTFDTSTDTFGTRVNARNASSTVNYPTYPCVSNAISDNYLHVHYADVVVGRGSVTDYTFYINMVLSSSTWGTRRTIGSRRNWPDISTSQDSNFPMLSCVDLPPLGIPNIDAYIGNAENATSFTIKNSVSTTNSVAYNICQIVEDAWGNRWIAFPELSSRDVSVVQNKAGDPWSTWQTKVEASINGADNVSITTRSYGKCIPDKYIAYIGDGIASRPNILHDFNVFIDDSWNNAMNLDSASAEHIRAKYSRLFNHGGTKKFEWVYEVGDDIKYDAISINGFAKGAF